MKFKKVAILPLISLLIFITFFLHFTASSYGQLYSTFYKPTYFFVAKRIQEGVYPFFFNNLNGTNIIGDSMVSILYPIKLLLLLTKIDLDVQYYISLFSQITLAVIFIFFFLKKKFVISNDIFLKILFACLFLSLPFFQANIVHEMWVGSFCLFFSIILVYLLYLQNFIKYKIFLLINSILSSLLIIVGGWHLQWIFITSFFISIIMMKLKFNNINFFKTISPLMFGFGISSIQFFLSWDLASITERKIGFFDFDGFNNFASSISYVGFINQIASIELLNIASNTFGGLELTVSTISCGLAPVIFFFSDLKRSGKEVYRDPIKFFLISIILICFIRSLGGLFLPNLIIHGLPFFGQFRTTFRELIGIEVIIIIYSLYLFSKNQLKIDDKVLISLCYLSIILGISVFLINFFLDNISYKIFLSVLIPMFIIIISKYYKKNICKKIIILSIFELFFTNALIPNDLNKRVFFNEVKNCNLPLEFKPAAFNIFNSANKREYYYNHNIYGKLILNSENIKESQCPFISQIDYGTLTPVHIRHILQNQEKYDDTLSLYLALNFKNVHLKIDNIDVERSLLKIKDIKFPELHMNNDKLNFFTYEILKKINLDNYFFIEKNYKTIVSQLNSVDVSIAPFAPNRLIFFDQNYNVIKASNYGPFKIINGKFFEVNIFYVPILEILGLFFLFLSLITLSIICLKTK
jgi:hypothetical protein